MTKITERKEEIRQYEDVCASWQEVCEMNTERSRNVAFIHIFYVRNHTDD
jgi:hypothetical protein